MKRLKNGIYKLEETDSIKDLAFVFNNNFNIILFSLLSEPNTDDLDISGPTNSIITGVNLSFYKGLINITNVEFVNTDFTTTNRYITDKTKINYDPNLSELQTLITSITAPSNAGRLKITDWVSIINGVISKYIIGTELSLVSWVCQAQPKVSLLSCYSQMNRASTKLGIANIKLDRLIDNETKIREIKNYLTEYKEEFQSHNHDSLDIKTGLFDSDKLGLGLANVTTYLKGNKTWGFI